MEDQSVREPGHHVHLVHPSHWKLLETQGTFSKLHATHAKYHDPHLDASLHWSSRRHRKGRPIEVLPDAPLEIALPADAELS